MKRGKRGQQGLTELDRLGVVGEGLLEIVRDKVDLTTVVINVRVIGVLGNGGLEVAEGVADVACEEDESEDQPSVGQEKR